jgi:hypothetical protein
LPAVSEYIPESGLTPFEGNEVAQTSVAIRNAGDGLSSALKVDPLELKIGDTDFVAVRCDVVALDFKPVKGAEDTLNRVHILRATDATLVDSDVVSKQIDAQRERINLAREREKGILRLPLGEVTPIPDADLFHAKDGTPFETLDELESYEALLAEEDGEPF